MYKVQFFPHSSPSHPFEKDTKQEYKVPTLEIRFKLSKCNKSGFIMQIQEVEIIHRMQNVCTNGSTAIFLGFKVSDTLDRN